MKKNTSPYSLIVRFFVFASLFSLLFVLIACGEVNTDETKELDTEPTNTVEPTNTSRPTNTPKPTAEPINTIEPTAEPTDTPKPTNTPRPTNTPKPTTPPVPTAEPTQPPAPTTPPEPTSPPAASPSQVVITNVDKVAEFVDIKNIGGSDQDLSGWVLVSEKGNQACSLGGVLPAGASLRIWAMASDGGQGGFNCGFGSNIWNNSDSDPAVLYDASGAEVSRR